MCRRRLPKIAFDYIEGSVEDEIGVERNREGFLHYRLVPRYLVDVKRRDLSTTLFGQTYSLPFGFGPTGTMGLFRRGSELMLAQAAREANVPYVMSGASDYLLRVVASDLAAYEEFLRTRLTRMPGVSGVQSSFALKRVAYRTNLPLRRKR